MDFAHKNSDGNGNVILESRKTEIVNKIVTEVRKVLGTPGATHNVQDPQN